MLVSPWSSLVFENFLMYPIENCIVNNQYCSILSEEKDSVFVFGLHWCKLNMWHQCWCYANTYWYFFNGIDNTHTLVKCMDIWCITTFVENTVSSSKISLHAFSCCYLWSQERGVNLRDYLRSILILMPTPDALDWCPHFTSTNYTIVCSNSW